MPKIEPFEVHTQQYEKWFIKHKYIYLSEVKLLKSLLPTFNPDEAIEIGVGTGLFASKLGITKGIEPSPKMAQIAKQRGIEVINGVAEQLPLKKESFSLVLMVTTICFVDNPQKSLQEIWRILKYGGSLIIAFVDKNTDLGRFYLKNKSKSKFYQPAQFFSTEEILNLLSETGFKTKKIHQTLEGMLDDISEIQQIKESYGECAFVGIKAVKTL